MGFDANAANVAMLKGYVKAARPMEEMFSVKDKVAVVTGATSGLGFNIALRLLQGGANVVIAGSSQTKGEYALPILEEAGFQVDVAGDGQIAVDMLQKSDPGYYQLVLMDVQMPLMNGYEATRLIRKFEDKKLAAIPILAMTANAFEEDRREALMCGMNGHIAKPIEVEKLFDMMDKVMT